MKEKPAAFYKYQPVTPQSLGNLASSAVFFCSTEDFNDPFDCAIETHINRPTYQELNRFRDRLAEEKGRDSPEIEELFCMGRPALREVLWPMLLDSFESLRREHINNIGVACFSESPHNTLMWSHYAERGKGFCLEFSADAEIFSKAMCVKYESRYPTIDGVSLLLSPDVKEFHKLIRTKSKDWAYEREWRAFHRESRRLFHYDEGDLTAVYFGPRSAPGTQNAIAMIARELHPSVKLFLGKISNSEFRIDFEERGFSSKRIDRGKP
jgi:hypothetical protein